MRNSLPIGVCHRCGYALIDPDTRRVEVFRPGDDALWKLFDMSDSEALEFASVGTRILYSMFFRAWTATGAAVGIGRDLCSSRCELLR